MTDIVERLLKPDRVSAPYPEGWHEVVDPVKKEAAEVIEKLEAQVIELNRCLQAIDRSNDNARLFNKEINSLIERFRWCATDWDGKQMPDGEPVKGDPTAGELRAAVEEIERLRNALDLYERERERFRHNKPEITGAYFLTGGHGEKDDNQLPQYVRICPAYGCGWEQVYEKTDRTVSYEGS